MLTTFKKQIVNTGEVKINAAIAGSGFPLLLLHGYPQTHVMWHKIAPALAEEFTVIATDLRGYGDSDKPKGTGDRETYSKRTMARDQVAVMSQLGYEEFYLVGHDRSARVAHRLALDYPDRVKKLVVLDIVPTYQMYVTSDREFASAYYHWFFLIQPYPLPETLIGGDPEFFLHSCLKHWSRDFSAFTPDALAEYLRCFNDPDTIHGTCEDYRASATIDLIEDEADMDRKIQCPVLVLWGNKGIIGRKYDVLASWRDRAHRVIGKAIDCGHFLSEEAPQDTYREIRHFLQS